MPLPFCAANAVISATRDLVRIALAVTVLGCSGTVQAGFDEGVRAFERNDHAAALREFRTAADTGHAGAQYYLGRMRLMGDGVETDYRKAAEFFRKAAAQGQVNAQFYLAVLHYLGEGVTRDHAKAIKWFEAAAAQGDPLSQYYLGVMHAAGEGVSRDTVQAFFWFTLSAEAGNETAAKFRDIISRNMAQADIATAKRRVSRWKREH